MSSSSRRSRNSLVGGKQASADQPTRKRNAEDGADESNLAFGSNVSIVFKGDESSLGDQEEDDQRAGKLQKVELNSSISEASANIGSSRPVRQAALKSRRSLTATIAATTRRRQSARLSQNFKAELGARANSSMAEALPPASAAGGSLAYSEAPSTIGSVGDLYAASSSGFQPQAGPSSQAIFNQHLALNADQSKDRRLSLPARRVSQLLPPAAAHLRPLHQQQEQMVLTGQPQQLHQATGTAPSGTALPYHRSSSSQPLDDVTAALLNKEHSDISILNQQQHRLLQLQQRLQEQQLHQPKPQQISQLKRDQHLKLQQHQNELQEQEQKQSPQDCHLKLQQAIQQSQSMAENSNILNYQRLEQQPTNVRSNNTLIGAGEQINRPGSGSSMQQVSQSSIVFTVSPGNTYSALPSSSLSTSYFPTTSSIQITQQNSIPMETVARPAILKPIVTIHPSGQNVVSGMSSTNYQTNGALANSSQYNDVRQVPRNSSSGNTSTSTTGGRQSSVSLPARGHNLVQARPAERHGSCSSDDDVLIIEPPRARTPEACANNTRTMPPSSSSASIPSFYRPSCLRPSPLPPLTWADRNQVWRHMCLKDRIYKRSADTLKQHPAVHQRMRAILLDWLSEVCEVYALHRETYYLAIDYIDRYLMVTKNVPKQQLQLLGITCLFIAAKVEEIYPPKISEFAYVTDGACRVEQITEKELVVVKTLSWNLSPLTINTWLNTYLQLLQEITRSTGSGTGPDGLPLAPTEFVYQRFSGQTFVQICRLLDLCILDTNSLQFSPALLTASALSYFFGSHIARKVSSFTSEDLQPAQQWMKAFAQVVQGLPEQAPVKSFRHVPSEDSHNIQTKVVELDTLERAQKKQEELEQEDQLERAKQRMLTELNAVRGQPWTNGSPPPVSLLTPPKSDEKRDTDMNPSESTSDHLIHSSCPSSSGVSSAVTLEAASVHGSFSNANVNMSSVAGAHRPVYNSSDAMEVS